MNSNNYHIELAKMFKKNENIDYIGIIIGTVEEINPLKISIYNKNAFFTGNDLYVCKNATEYQIPFTLSSSEGIVSGKITHEGLKTGDKVAVIATEDNQKLFIIDKVV